MRGIISAAASLPHWRLQRSAIAAFHGAGGRAAGARTVATYDQDAVTLAVEAGRLALRSSPGAVPRSLSFTTTTPTYLEKTNATVVHAALRLPTTTAAFDLGGAVRSGIGALGMALGSSGTALVTAADLRVGLPGGSDEANGCDAGAAVFVGDDAPDTPVIAEVLGTGSATREFLDRWRVPGEARTRQWEEKFGENNYVALAATAWTVAFEDAGIDPGSLDAAAVFGPHGRAVGAVRKRLGVPDGPAVLSGLGCAGAADAALATAALLEHAAPGQVLALVSLSDGVDVVVLRTTEALARWSPARTLVEQLGAGDESLPYGKYLAWRGLLAPEPPRRPEPARASASAAGRSIDWKFGFVGSRDRTSGAVHLPPARISFEGGAQDDMEPLPMADATGTIVTFTVDRLAYSQSPPVIFAVVDFDGGGRLPVELTDATPEQVTVGGRVEMTFRRLNTADGIANYFWKSRLVPDGRASASIGEAPA